MQKQWTRHEWINAQERALKEIGQTYILPIRLDDTDLPGLPSTVAYLDAHKNNLDKIVDLALQKLNSLYPSQPFALPLLKWCAITQGSVSIDHGRWDRYEDWHPRVCTYEVAAFYMGKYPVTNAQFQAFIVDKEGYRELHWWDFSSDAMGWARNNPRPLPVKPEFASSRRPRINVNWYEMIAFCRWLSHKTGLTITLPTQQQWLRAAQGDSNHDYPWGDEFDASRGNTPKSGIGRTTPVTRYPAGASPFGVYDMFGNVMELCMKYENYEIGTPANSVSTVWCGNSWCDDGWIPHRSISRQIGYFKKPTTAQGFRVCIPYL